MIHHLGVVLDLLGRIFVVPVRDRFTGPGGGLCTVGGAIERSPRGIWAREPFTSDACGSCDPIWLSGMAGVNPPSTRGLLIYTSKLIAYCEIFWETTYWETIMRFTGLEERIITKLVLFSSDLHTNICLMDNQEVNTCSKKGGKKLYSHQWRPVRSVGNYIDNWHWLLFNAIG